MTTLYVKKLTPLAVLPAKATRLAAAMDIRACLHTKTIKVFTQHGEVWVHVTHGTLSLQPGDRALIPTGLAMRPAPDHCIKFYPRSGLSLKKGLTLINCVGVGDEDYSLEYCITLVNHSREVQAIADGERLCQMMVERAEPVELVECEELPDVESYRLGRFGSSGV